MRLSISIELSLLKDNLCSLTWHMGFFHFQRWEPWLGWRALDKISCFMWPVHKRDHLGLMGRKEQAITRLRFWFFFGVVLLDSVITIAYNHRWRQEGLLLFFPLFPFLLFIGFTGRITDDFWNQAGLSFPPDAELECSLLQEANLNSLGGRITAGTFILKNTPFSIPNYPLICQVTRKIKIILCFRLCFLRIDGRILGDILKSIQFIGSKDCGF